MVEPEIETCDLVGQIPGISVWIHGNMQINILQIQFECLVPHGQGVQAGKPR
jgi:hypothetical protein